MVEAQIIDLKRLVEQDLEETKKRLASLEEESNTLDKMLDIYKRRIGSSYAKSISSIDHKDFDNKTLRDSLHFIAKRNNNTIVVKDAVKLMKGANLFGNPDNAASVVYAILNRSPEFEKIGSGMFRLLSKEQIQAIIKPTITKIHRPISNVISFKNAVTKVLKDANGEPLTNKEIWKRMQAIGVNSNAKDPAAWVNRLAKDVGAEKYAPKTWRWIFSAPEQKTLEINPITIPGQTYALHINEPKLDTQ
jgi:hypothetical protein